MPKIIPIAFLPILLSVTLAGTLHPGKMGAIEMQGRGKAHWCPNREWEDTRAEQVPAHLLVTCSTHCTLPMSASQQNPQRSPKVLPKPLMVPFQVAPYAPAVPVSLWGL